MKKRNGLAVNFANGNLKKFSILIQIDPECEDWVSYEMTVKKAKWLRVQINAYLWAMKEK